MKATRKLIPAIALLLVSAVLLSTASYAWFTTNKTVNTDMTVSVTAPQNLQISVDDGATYASYADFRPYTEVEGVKVPVYTKLTPVSSGDGKYFTLVSGLTLGADGVIDQDQVDGLQLDEDDEGYLEGDIAKVGQDNSSEGVAATETYYLQYDFLLKATQPIAASTFDINVAIASKTQDEGTDGVEQEAYLNAIRVFIFREGVLVNSTVGENDCYPIQTNEEGTTFTVATDALTATNTEAGVTFDSNVPQNWTIVIWIEGNDPDCVSANIDSTPDVDIKVTFSINETP